MQEIRVKFTGRRSGAIGRLQQFHDTVLVPTDDEEVVRLALYEGRTVSGQAYEHLSYVCIQQDQAEDNQKEEGSE